MPKKTTPLKRWLDRASPTERRILAKEAGTTANYLSQLGNGQRTASAELAGAIAKATVSLHRVNLRLPILRREQLAPACASCEYAKRCQGE